MRRRGWRLFDARRSLAIIDNIEVRHGPGKKKPTPHLDAGDDAKDREGAGYVSGNRMDILALFSFRDAQPDGALAPGFASFLWRPFVRRAFLVCGPAALAGNFPSLLWIH